MTIIDQNTAHALAVSLAKVYDSVSSRIVEDNASSPLVARVTGHLGCPLSEAVVVEEKYRLWEHAGLQSGTDHYLAAHSPGAQWFGVMGGERRWESIINMLLYALRDGSRLLGRPDYGSAPVGPAESMEVVQLGMVESLAPDGTPVVLVVSSVDEYQGHSMLTVLSSSRTAASAVRDEIERLKRLHDPFKGQVMSFGFSEHKENELLTFLPRPSMTAEEVVLPEGRLEAVEEHVVGIAALKEQLIEAGQHLRRGLLLYGPPGTGKTHTVRYLVGRLREHTAILMSGPGMRHLDYAVGLARKLQPSIVVIEDVDLIAEDRSHFETSPLLFSLLDAMDGITGEADVSFVLTTNRVETLERALVQRPGRVDLAVEVPPPSAPDRERLVRLYARNRPVEADVAKVVDATEGVTAAFVKELLRRVILLAIRAGEHALTDEHFDTAFQAMSGDAQALTRALLGAGDERQVRTPSRFC
ncbi:MULTISPECIES: AAA family ATPase [Nonomuraea]|uniref:AAA family ATPase n=1 Tax=Nonomuraea mangrovi TaxID=2316207 RepID=A0ABW4STE2_9ACTN